jgi:DNA-binding transcriptional regulator YhcF (GntR family)
MSIDPADPRPVFRQIVDEVQRCVAIGVLKPSDALPAARILAAELKVNANTVQHAYRTLEQEGTVNVRRGLGTFVAAPKTRDLHVRQQAVARQIAEKMLREGYRQGLLASDLMNALQEIAPRRGEGGVSGTRGQEKV